jgi:hypothetical protein
MQPQNLITETQPQNTKSIFYSRAETLSPSRSIFITLLTEKKYYMPIFKPNVIMADV